MAVRPVFIPMQDGKKLVEVKYIDFEWHAGLHYSQKQKSIRSLHTAFLKESPCAQILEVSSKSENTLGIDLSAFNLIYDSQNNKDISVEATFQSSKVFSEGGPYKDILEKNSKDAKKDERLRNSGALISFECNNVSWELEPKTAFYDWIYLNALDKNSHLKKQVLAYDAFTDIEFNPKKSINCQAYSLALYVSLVKRNLFTKEIISEKDSFLSLIEGFEI
ncbi:DarT1-associated NADAR antitoxin family protein [Acinetobacter lanii]|uniref:Uncharacterized protein n=1 Tax=Acinetobacter lanii TaxID=2715163 RepID=A0A6G8S408_9GAMM|nr:hypothetical protein [Acinetobacter lanii]QIO08871.1 hypothetical protein G8D99_07465 [Acinetobacter lanii]